MATNDILIYSSRSIYRLCTKYGENKLQPEIYSLDYTNGNILTFK